MKTTTVRIQEAQHKWIIENRPNQLSRIVRDHLDDLIQQQTPVNYHNAWRESAQKCFPFMQGGYCALCWPVGVPPKVDWQAYLKDNGVGSYKTITFEEWSMIKHGSRQAQLKEWNTDQHTESESSTRISWFRRFFFKES